MAAFHVRTDLQRAVIKGFALPLGIEPGAFNPPTPGYTIAYDAGKDDEPDTYAFYVTVSHERVAGIMTRMFDLLPEEVCGIVEISSCDAYRAIDVYISREEMTRSHFLKTWKTLGPVLLEDSSIAAGANSETPFVEIFLDQWKGISIIVPLSMRDDVESILREFDLNEVPETWAVGGDNPALEEAQIRPVLQTNGAEPVEIDDVLWQLRADWNLEINIDPDTNVDDSGRDLGMTLWHAMVALESARGEDEQADIAVWATAGSLTELLKLIDDALDGEKRWQVADVFTTDRVAFDERPDDLSDLAPKGRRPALHMVSIEVREEA